MKSKFIKSFTVVIVLLTSFLKFTTIPANAEPRPVRVWVLVETLVNPHDAPKEFYGGGRMPNWFPEPRFEGKHLIYGVTETSFRVDDREVDHGYEFHNVTVETFFQKPPEIIRLDETIDLAVGFSHSGTAEDMGAIVQFWYYSDDVSVEPDFAFTYAPWVAGFDGVDTTAYRFKTPIGQLGDTFEIHAGWWNAAPCTVTWKYRVQEEWLEDREDINPNEFVEPEFEPMFPDRDLGDEECARMQQEVADQIDIARGPNVADLKLGIIGRVIVSYGQSEHDFCTDGQDLIKEGSEIKIGDCVRTIDSEVFIEMNDQDDLNGWEATEIMIGPNSSVCFDEFILQYDHSPPRRGGVVELVYGALHAVTKAWKGTSIFSVKAGINSCGIRGSEVFLHYDPEVNLLQAQVLEGHMDVTSGLTDETVSLTDNQQALVTQGDIIILDAFSQEDWESNLEAFGIREIYPPTPESETSSVSSPEFNVGSIILILCCGLLCITVLITILVGTLFLLRKGGKS